MSSMTFDLSTGGAFVTLNDELKRNKAKLARNLRVGTFCSIRLALDQINVIHCTAEIVRHAQPKGGYPAGFAVRFIRLESEQLRILERFIDQGTTDAVTTAA